MKTDFSETIGIWPLPANSIDRLLTESEGGEEFNLLGDSAGFTEEVVEEKARRISRATSIVINIPPNTWGTIEDLSDLAAENILLRREMEQIKQRVVELEKRIPEEKVIVLREISREQAKQEIQQLFSSGRTLYYSDIAEELGLDLELVVDICRELQQEREIKVDDHILRAGGRPKSR
jgi:regulator of replication initiation timing